jgi:hypothetical protein
MKELESGVLKIEESESEVLRTDSTALLHTHDLVCMLCTISLHFPQAIVNKRRLYL